MKALLLCTLFTTQAWCQVSKFEIRNFNFDYKAPYGEGAADAFSIGKLSQERQMVRVERVADDFEILLQGVEDRSLTLKGAPDFMTGADFMKLSALNLQVSNSLSLSLASGYFQSPLRIMSVKNLTTRCDSVNNFSQIFEGCLKSMGLKAGEINSEGEGLLQAIFDEGRYDLTSQIEVKDLDLRLNAGKFTLTADVKSSISGKVKSRGEVTYALPLKRVTIRVDEVKFGILNVTSKVFEEIKKHESDKMKVNQPYVYLQME